MLDSKHVTTAVGKWIPFNHSY